MIADLDTCDLIGNTPLVKLKNIVSSDSASVYVKLEKFNWGGSIKSRVAWQMISQAEADGILIPHSGQTIIEPTGGNTGIGLAILGRRHGYRVTLVVPDNYSRRKIMTLRTYGADVLLSDSTKGRNSHLTMVEGIVANHKDYVFLNQFRNPANPNAHYNGTAQEILRELPKLDCFVAAAGSGGTITGVGRRLKDEGTDATVVLAQPEGCDVLKGTAISHPIQAIALGFKLPLLDESVIDEVYSVLPTDALTFLKNIAIHEGLFLGLSSGVNIACAVSMAKKLKRNRIVVTVAPDSGRDYLEENG